MITIGEGSFVLEAPVLKDAALRAYARRLFDEFDGAANDALPLEDYGLHLELEQGSLKGKSLLFVTLAGLYGGIAQYPDFVQGVRLIGSHAKHVVDSVNRFAASDRPTHLLKSKRADAATLSQLSRLFEAVARGQLSPDEATLRARDLLNADDEAPPGFVEDLTAAIRNIRLNPQQIALLPPELAPAPETPTVPRSPRGPAELPAADQRNRLKIEMHREHKHGRTKVKITALGKARRARKR